MSDSKIAIPNPDCIRGVVGVLEHDHHFLLIKRSRYVRAPGKWCFAGGAIDPGETAAQAIVREYREELGLTVNAGRKLWEWLREDGGLHLEWYEVRCEGGSLAPNPLEVAAIQWMSDEQIRAHPEMIANNTRFLDVYRSRLDTSPKIE